MHSKQHQAPQTQIDEKQLAAAIADRIHTDIKSRLQNDKEFVNTVVSAYDRVAKQYSEDINTTHNCLKQNNSYLQLTEKRYKEPGRYCSRSQAACWSTIYSSDDGSYPPFPVCHLSVVLGAENLS